MSKRLLIVFLLCHFCHVYASERILFKSGTEDSTVGWGIPSEEIARVVIGFDGDNEQYLKEKIKEDGLMQNYRQFLSIKSINLSTVSKGYKFIRPKSNVYSPLYGAHSYQYWIVDGKNEIVFYMSGDEFQMLEKSTNGMHDIVSRQCRGSYGCFDTRFAFIKNEYIPISCVGFHPSDAKKMFTCESWDK